MSRRILLAAVVILLLAGVTYGATRPGFEEIPQAAADVTTTEAPTTTKASTTTVAPTTTAPETTTTTAYVPPTTQYVPPTTVYVAPPTTVWVEPAYEEPAYEEPVASNASSGDRAFLECVVHRESSGDPTAVNSSSGASGLFQYLDSTWANLGYVGRYGVSKASYASPAQQWEAAYDTLASVGRSPWNGPGC